MNLKRAVTQKLNKIELWFLCMALHPNVIYLYVKFEGTSFYTLEVMPRSTIQSSNLQRAIPSKIDGIQLWFLYTALVLNVIYLCL